MEQALEGADAVHRVKRGRPAKVAAVEAPVECFEPVAQQLAMRIWFGQSPDVPVIERVSRIANGLKEQGLSIDIELPHPDAGRYLNAHK